MDNTLSGFTMFTQYLQTCNYNSDVEIIYFSFENKDTGNTKRGMIMKMNKDNVDGFQ